MNSDKSHSSDARPREEHSSRKKDFVAGLTQEVSRLLDHLEDVLAKDGYIPSKASERVAGRTIQADYFIPEFREEGEVPLEDQDVVLSSPMDMSVVIDQREREEALKAGNISFSYLRGLLEHRRRNLDVAISHLTRCYDLALEAGSLEYVVKSQIQLAVLHLRRYRKCETLADYRLALHYSNNLVQMGMKKEHVGRLRGI